MKEVELYQYNEQLIFVRSLWVPLKEDGTYKVPINHTKVRPPDGLFKATFDEQTQTWYEGKTQAEFEEDAFIQSLTPSATEIADAELEIKIINILLEVM